MNRRTLLQSALPSAVAAVSWSELKAQTNARSSMSQKPHLIELKKYQLRNTTDGIVKKTIDFLGEHQLSALQKAGAVTTAAFRSGLGPGTPYVVTLASFPDMAAYETASQKLASDSAYQKALSEFNGNANMNFLRMETSLLRGFPTAPAIEIPKVKQGVNRVFELRTYESNNSGTLARKIKMFDDGEIALFRKVGMSVVFFGETIVGPNMPNLTYLVAYDSLADRERIWKDFVTSDEWKVMSKLPGLSDGEVVSNISAEFLSALPFSNVK
jgi:hypothetical protein